MATLNISPLLLALFLSAVTYSLVYLLFIRGKAFGKKEIPLHVVQAAGMRDPISRIFDHEHKQFQQQEPELSMDDEEETGKWELVEDDTSILLKEAESVIDQISAVVTNIASDPPNSAEVFTKIRAIVSQYGIFQNTEFYDAIKRYVAVTVDRDLALRFTEAELEELWS